ncbi:phosphotransferase [Kitasatospora sp. RG8]|nr:phosphotransferase [Kitasatospora sp. RG8]
MPVPGATSPAVALQSLLADLCSSPVTVEGWETLEPWAVVRVRLGGTAAARSVVVKWMQTGRDRSRTAAWRLRTELAALQFLGEDLGVGLTPRVIAADTAARFLVLEDLAPRTALDRLLRRDGAAAHSERLVAFARARGELSAASAGEALRYYSRRARLGPVDPAADRAGRLAPLRDTAIRHAAVLGAPVDGRATHELTAALDELHHPGPFLALSNGDAEANNILLHPSGPADARLIDFEYAGYTHALTDAVCLYVPGPAWMTVGDPATTGLADHYRHALARGIAEAEDDQRYGYGLAAACMSWALVRLQRFALLDTRPPGDPSRLQLIATLEAAARTAEAHRALPHLTAWTHRIAALLRRRWPDADQDFADPARFPPYRARN